MKQPQIIFHMHQVYLYVYALVCKYFWTLANQPQNCLRIQVYVCKCVFVSVI